MTTLFSSHEYIESYLDGHEIVYDQRISTNEITITTTGTIFSDLKQLIDNSANIQMAIINEDTAGNSIILGDDAD